MSSLRAEISFQEISAQLKPDSGFEDELQIVLEDVHRIMKPASGFCVFDDVTINEESITVNETEFLCHQKICKLLYGSTRIAIFVCTLGEAVSVLYTEYANQQDFVKAYLCDRIVNKMMERIVNETKENIRRQAEQRQQRITSHLGPGYCDWPIEEQKKLFSLLPPSPCGILLTPSFLMQPMKSVSAVVGIGTDVAYEESGCKLCQLKKCTYKKETLH